MAIKYDPNAMLRKAAPKRTLERLVTKRLTVNRAVLTHLTNADVLTKKKLTEVAVRVIRGYKDRYKDELADGASSPEAKEEAQNGNRLLVQRVQNAMVQEIAKGIQSEYRGEFYIWLPSDASTPDPLHQLKYGKRFQIGKGEMPGDRVGCRCGMQILVKESRLQLGE